MKGSRGQPRDQPEVFPQEPLIPRFGISVDPEEDIEGTADVDGDGVNEWYLGHVNEKGVSPYLLSDQHRRLWLNFAGWEDSSQVTDASRNTHCHLAEIERRMRDEPRLATSLDWYHADVDDLDSLERLVLGLDVAGTNLGTYLRDQYDDIWVIWYYFFYPAHEALLKDCEQRLDDGRDGSHEGDWSAMGIFVRRPKLLPWEHGTPFPEAERVFYSVRLRGVAKALAPDMFKLGMLEYAWTGVERVPPTSTHHRAYVARGSHNLYRNAGEQPRTEPTALGFPIEEYSCGAVNMVDQVVDDINEFVDDVGETAKDVLVLWAKVAAGAAIGSGIPLIGTAVGALGGAIAGLVEAFSSSSDQPSPPPTTGTDYGPPPQQYGVVLTPPELSQPLVTDNPNPNKNETARKIRLWTGSVEESLVDRARQIWWPGDEANDRPGYSGAWGVRCTDDSFRLRSGIPFPDFKKALLNKLVVGFSEEEAKK